METKSEIVIKKTLARIKEENPGADIERIGILLHEAMAEIISKINEAEDKKIFNPNLSEGIDIPFDGEHIVFDPEEYRIFDKIPSKSHTLRSLSAYYPGDIVTKFYPDNEFKRLAQQLNELKLAEKKETPKPAKRKRPYPAPKKKRGKKRH